jgi:hypothetical protein
MGQVEKRWTPGSFLWVKVPCGVTKPMMVATNTPLPACWKNNLHGIAPWKKFRNYSTQ